MAGRGKAIFIDSHGQTTTINVLGIASLAAMKTYAQAVAGKSSAGLKMVSFSTMEVQATVAPKTGSNVDKCGIVIAQDELGRTHQISVPAIEAANIEETAQGDRIKKACVDAITAAYKTAIGASVLTGMYGYPIQTK